MAFIKVSSTFPVRIENSIDGRQVTEVWESMLATLLEDLETSDCLPVEEIWALDCVNQGDSAILNEDTLGGVCKSLQIFAREA